MYLLFRIHLLNLCIYIFQFMYRRRWLLSVGAYSFSQQENERLTANMRLIGIPMINMGGVITILFGERAKRARHSQVCSIENRGYIYIYK